MRGRVVIFVVVIGLALGIGWYGAAQDSSLGLNFSPGDILTAADMNTIVAQVDANTAAISTNTNGSSGAELRCEATLSREQEAPESMGGTLEEGRIVLDFDAGFTQVTVNTLTLDGDSMNVVAAHLHCNRAGENGPVAFGFLNPGNCTLDAAAGTLDCPNLVNADFTGNDCIPVIGRPVSNIAALFFAAREGLIYANVHTTDNAGGEVRGQLLCDG